MDHYNRDLEDVYSEHRQQLFTCALAVTRCPELAEDAVHDAFCRLAQRPTDVENLKAYVFRSVRNAAIDHARRRGREVGQIDEYIFDPSPGPAQQAEENESRSRAILALDSISSDERETIIQHLYGELTFREIAEVRGAPQGTVTAWYRRGLARLRQLLEE